MNNGSSSSSSHIYPANTGNSHPHHQDARIAHQGANNVQMILAQQQQQAQQQSQQPHSQNSNNATGVVNASTSMTTELINSYRHRAMLELRSNPLYSSLLTSYQDSNYIYSKILSDEQEAFKFLVFPDEHKLMYLMERLNQYKQQAALGNGNKRQRK